jgi:hypothetical protein
MASKGSDELVVVHAKGTMTPDEVYDALPQGRFAFLIAQTSYEQQRKDGSDYTMYEALWLSAKGDTHSFGFYSKMRVLRPYYPGNGRASDTLYWSGESPKDIVDAFVKGANVENVPTYVDKEGYGFIKFNGKGDVSMLPVLMSALMFYQPEESKYNFAYVQNTRGRTDNQSRFGQRSQQPRSQQPREPHGNRQPPVQPRPKNKVVDDEGFGRA